MQGGEFTNSSSKIDPDRLVKPVFVLGTARIFGLERVFGGVTTYYFLRQIDIPDSDDCSILGFIYKKGFRKGP
jgi:hypothetical protein